MAYTIRNLIDDAYHKSGVVGIGMTMQSYQLSEGLSALNLILDDVYAVNQHIATITLPVTFDGRADYTFGPQPEDILTDPVPDIEIDIIPLVIEGIITTNGGVRNTCVNTTPEKYYARSLDSISNAIPAEFFYERTSPLATIRFFEGTPSGPGELIYKQALVEVTANTSYTGFPKSLRPYLVHKLGAVLAADNAFDATNLHIEANSAWARYRTSTYQGQSYHCDASAPSSDNAAGKYNIFRGD